PVRANNTIRGSKLKQVNKMECLLKELFLRQVISYRNSREKTITFIRLEAIRTIIGQGQIHQIFLAVIIARTPSKTLEILRNPVRALVTFGFIRFPVV